MKILIVDHYYPNFLSQFVASHPELPSLSYDRHLRQLLSEQFGTSDFYSHVLNVLGQEACEVIVNYDSLQEQWAKENGLREPSASEHFLNLAWQKLPYLSTRKASPRQLAILDSQIRSFHPDVLYIQIPTYLPTSFLRRIKKYTNLIVGQIAAPIPPFHRFSGFDLMITSLPHFVDKFKKMGLKAEYLPLCFDPRVLSKNPLKRIYPITFVGSFFFMHSNWLSTLSKVAKVVKLKIWGSPDPKLSAYQGEAWGRDMYSVLQKSQITLNRHSVVAGEFANNMRLFEATGCGAMLITDAKSNLKDFFVEGKEIVSYGSEVDLINKVKYYLAHPVERGIIARAGQKRTLKDHTYKVRMKQLLKIIERYL